ncbi:MAG: type II secretion system F family protein [Nitriliruptor sp.]
MATATLSKFDYQVRDRSGKMITGQLEADNQAAVAAKLRSMGYAPVSIDEVKTSGMQTEIKMPFGGKVKLKDLAIFSRQFATMIGSGLALIRALSILAEQTENDKLREAIVEIREDIQRGQSLSVAIAKHDKVFPKLYVAMVRAGETAGMLDEVLIRVAVMLEADVKLRSKIKSAMTYPVIVFIMAILLSTVMLIFIVPTFAAMFDDLGGELPLMTKMLVSMSNFVVSPLGVVTYIIVPTVLWQAYKRIRATEKGRYTLDVIKLKLPVFGLLFHKIALTRFARNLSTLLAAGVPILQAFEITADTVNSGPISDAVKDVQDSVRQGESIAVPLGKHEIFPPMVVQMIAVGEETGNIDGMLEKVADFYDTEVEAMTESLTALMEPLMIGVIGGIVGGMVIALYMPMFKIFEVIGDTA